MCWVRPSARLVPCSPCAAVVPGDWGEPGPLATGLLTAVRAGKDEDGGVFAVVDTGRSGGMSAYSHMFYSAVALTLFFCASKSGARGPRFVKMSSNLSILFA